MYNPDDRELDRLSAAAGENYTPPGNPNWQALERTLDKELPQKKDKRRRGLFWFFLLPGLFIAGATFYWNTRPASPAGIGAGGPAASVAKTPANTSPATTSTDKPTPGATHPGAATDENKALHSNTAERPLLPTLKPVPMPSHAPAANPVKNNPVKNNTTTTRTTDKKAADIAYQPARTASNNEKRDAFGPVSKKKTHSGISRPGANNTGSDGIAGKTSLVPAGRKGNTPASRNNAGSITDPVTDDASTGNDAVTNNTLKDSKPLTGSPVAASGTITPSATPSATPPPATDTPAIAKTKPADTILQKKQADTAIARKKKNEKAFSIGITGGVDLSTVKFNYSAAAGYNIGLIAGYHFNKNWSVHTGAIYTKKNYKLEGYNYHFPANTWPANYKIDLVYGYCNMWELPVMGRYTFNSRTSTHLFAGAGISSYLMNREDYNYDYKRNGTTYTYQLVNTNKSQFWFSVLDFSAGIEKPLGRHIIGQLEPYAKLPLAGLGTGKIKLSSFGLNVTLQYKKKLGK